MKKLLLVMCVSMLAVMMVTPAFAEELWDPHLRGVDVGLAAGALPPPGFYFVNDLIMGFDKTFGPLYNYAPQGGSGTFPPNPSFPGGQNGKANSMEKLFAVVDVPTLLWVPSTCKFLGADYGVAIAQPFDYTNLRIQTNTVGNQNTNTFVGGEQWGAFNTILVPYILSWHLPCDFRIKTALAVAFDDATTSPENRISAVPFGRNGSLRNQGDGGIYAESGNGDYMFTPSVGISYLHAGWNLSAEFFYSFQTKDTATNYQTGDFFAADYTISYTCGKWTFGLGASEENQVANDSFDAGDGTGYHSQPNTKAEAYTIGPLVGYNFGPCSLLFNYAFPLYTNNDVGGEGFLFRLVVPLGKCGL